MSPGAAPGRLLIVAVDGPSAAGKGTLARAIALHYDLAYLDTGLLYRAVGARLLRAGRDPGDPAAAIEAAQHIDFAELSRKNLRDDAVAQAASRVAVNAGVRKALLGIQRNFAADPPAGPQGSVLGAVIDGRDIGTVVCPEAPVKFFVTASLEARARRRHQELIERYGKSIYARVLQDMRERDERDRNRAVSPLTPAADALVIDTTALTPEAMFAIALDHIKRCWQGAARQSEMGA
ncbi:MAG: (d)CMP kinase [Dongiaceae bacterium]